MTNLLYANNAVGTLAAAITNASTTITLNAGQAALFPNPSAPQVFYAGMTDAATRTLKEIVKVTAVSGNIFSVVRAQDGTAALSWNAGDFIEQCAIRLEMQGWENAAEGLFSTLAVPVTPSTTLGIVGTTLADNANAGSVGEYVLQAGGQVAVPNTVATNGTSFTLTAGDWDVYGIAGFVSSGGVNLQNLLAGISTTSGAFSSYPNAVSNYGGILLTSAVLAVPHNITAQMTRGNVSAPTVVYLIVQAGYTGAGSVGAVCDIYARRVR